MGALNIVEEKSLLEMAKEYIDKNNISITKFAELVGYDRSTISKYLAGKYEGDITELESAMESVIFHSKKITASGQNLPEKIAAYESKDYLSILGVCQSCQSFMGLGIVVGKSGYGKTYTLKQYAKMPRVAYIECDDTMGSKDLVEAIERSLGLPSGYGTIWRRVNGIRDFCNANKGYLIIVDEADKLISKYTTKKMEILRGIFDQSDVGMVIAGEPALEAKIKSYLERFANRVDFYAELRGLKKGEVKELLSNYDIDDDALAEMEKRAYQSSRACFRLFDRTLNNILRVLQESGETKITLDVIKKASDMMML